MMTQLHVLEFSMNVLLASHFISYTSTAALHAKFSRCLIFVLQGFEMTLAVP